MPTPDICRQNAHKIGGEIRYACYLQYNVCSVCLPLQSCSHLIVHESGSKSSLVYVKCLGCQVLVALSPICPQEF